MRINVSSNPTMTQDTKYTYPLAKNWRLNRRNFLKTAIAASVASSVPLWVSCNYKPDEFTLNDHQVFIVKKVQEFLFPEDENGPSANDLNAFNYFQWVLWEVGTDKEDKNYLIKGIQWVDEFSDEEKDSAFIKLKHNEQMDLLEQIITTDWGESWLSMMLTLIFEALFCDPIYGGNVNKEGWKWLEYNPGEPRPSEDLKLGHFLNFVKKNQ